MYYTLFGDSHLYSRWFSPDSGIIDETTLTATSSVDFSSADGMFISGGQLYFASSSTGNLSRVAFSGGTVSGSATVVSGPGVDGVNWKNRALFLAAAAPVNHAPTAAFTSNCTNLSCTFNGSGSTDSDGTIASYAWTFGDSTSGSGATPPVHNYSADGTYSVTLTVTDNQGATNSVSHNVTVAAAVNQPPTARFTSNCAALSCQFNGSTSTDPDGTISTYAWNYGDSTSGSGVNPPVHTYSTGGTYTVTLTVTDNQGGTNAVSHDVTVAAAATGIQYVGSASATGGNTKTRSVTVPNSAAAGNTALLFLGRASTATWTGPTGVTGWTQVGSYTSGTLVTTVWTKTLVAGDVGATVGFANSAYGHASEDLVVYSGVDTTSPIAAATQSGDVTSSSHLTPTATAGTGDYAVSYWSDRSTAPRTWTAPVGASVRNASTDTGNPTFQALITDSNGAVPAGSYGGLTATTDANTDRAAMWTIILNVASGAPANNPPAAAFTSNCTGLSCSFNGMGSSDSDGTIASYAWNFGDTTTGSGVTPAAHVYGGNGTYSVTLTVTDNQGATNAVSHDVTVAATGSGVQFVAATDAGGGNTKAKLVSVPSSAAAGQTALLFLARASTATWTGPTGVTGWTQIGTFTSGTLITTAWSKVLAAGDVGGTVRFDNAAYGHASVNLAVYSGVDTANPIAAFTQAGDAATANHVTPSATAGSGDWVVSYWADRSTATRTWTAPGSVTARDVSTDTANPTMQALVADSNGPVAAGSYGGLTATTDANTDRAGMWTIVLNAA